MNGYRRRRFTYSFRAWVGEDGGNADRYHERYCVCSPEHARSGTHYVGVHPCSHYRLWDLNWRNGANILRIERGQGKLTVALGPRYRRVTVRVPTTRR